MCTRSASRGRSAAHPLKSRRSGTPPPHDVGKIGIPDSVLLKPGSLDAAEWGVMHSHATIGAQILAGSTSHVIQMGERIALAHHERCGGTGYPQGIVGEEIPIEGRMCAVVNFFDALTTDRPYPARTS